jgi:hypothetical protein
MRWSVVPPSFRGLLPVAHKSRDSHDIVLLCAPCHAKLEAPYATHRRSLLAARGIDPADTARLVPRPAGARARSAARALSGRAAPHLPAARRAALERTLKEHFGVTEVTAALLRTAVDEPISRPRDDFSPPEVRLVALLLATEPEAARAQALHELQVSWRRCFVDALQPRRLPQGWSVEHAAASSLHPAAEGEAGASACDKVCTSGIEGR